MIITEFYEGQGLGNQLWTYTTARSIARKLDMNFFVLGYEKFKAKEFIEIEKGHENIISEDFTEFYERKYFDKELNFISSGFDERIYNLKENTKLNGLFQSEKYFFNNYNQITDFLVIKNDKFKINLENICIINLRGGEYKMHKDFILPKSYWENAMNNFKNIYNVYNFLIVTDDIKYAKSFLPGIEILEGNISDCFFALYHSKYVIVSNSTFSYFPIKLAVDNKVVIAPKFWARHKNSYMRWVSPANIYIDWLWQDIDGKLTSYDDNIILSENTEKYYLNSFNVLMSESNIIQNSIIPRKLKNILKKKLSYIFPKHIG